MNGSRFTRKSRERLLYIATGLVFLDVLAVLWVIPHVVDEPAPGAGPGMAVPVFWSLAVIHLVLLGLLMGKILASRRGRRLRKAGLIIPGIIMILMSMFLVDAAGAYMELQPASFSLAIILFISAFCDMIAGVIAIMLPARFPDHQHKTYK